MSLPTFKFTNFGAPTNNERVNSGLSSSSKMEKTGILSSIKDKARDTFKELPDISLEMPSSITGSGDDADGDGGSFFSFTTLIKFIIIGVIVWFMWGSLSNNSDFHLGMGNVGDNIKSFLKSMEEKGREILSRITNQPIQSASPSSSSADADADAESDSDSDDDNDGATGALPLHRPPVPPGMSNSSDKKPGFVNDDSKYTFLDKADRSYTGPSPRADDSTSVTQKHQAGKAGYCYIGEDRGFRSCVKVEAGDKCMSGQVFSRQEICVDPTLRE